MYVNIIEAAGMETGATDEAHMTSQCLVAIGRLQVTSTPNSSDLLGNTSATEFISRHSIDGKFTFVDQRYASTNTQSIFITDVTYIASPFRHRLLG